MKIQATRQDAYQLMHDGALALARVEAVGMRIDEGRLKKTIEKTSKQIKDITDRLRSDEVYRVWRRRFGEKTKLGSRDQLARVLFEEMGVKSKGAKQLGKRVKMDKDALGKIDLPFVKDYLKIEKLKKLRGTYLMGVLREVVEGYLHPVFNLHLARTYRSSSDSPNFQNIPIRDKEIGKLIRSCFIPRDGHVLVEIDFKALEVCIAACYHKDPVMLEYIHDPSKDMHRDMAAECYKLPVEQVTKDARFYAKNQFVFPEFYGSYFAQVAPNLWESIGTYGLKTVDGVGLRDHLKSKGIGNYDAFERHIKRVEENFWGRRFVKYAQWKKWWHERYLKTGGFSMLTGFRVDGVYARNDVINYPVQGAAFHILLWSLIQLVKWLVKNKMQSVIVGQIHDSLVADIHKKELDVFLAQAQEVMTIAVRKHWSWINIPLTIEVATSETNWYEKKEISL